MTEVELVRNVHELEAQLPPGDQSWACGCPRLNPPNRLRCKKCNARNPNRRNSNHAQPG